MKRIASILLTTTFIFSATLYAEWEKLTKEDVVALAKQGKSEDEIVSLLNESESEFVLTDNDRIWLGEQGVTPWVSIVMDMTPKERKEKLPIYYGPKLTKQDIINLTKKGMPTHEIPLMIAHTQSKFTLTDEEKKWLKSEGVDPLVIFCMETQTEIKKEKPFLERGAIERGGFPIRGGKYYSDAIIIKPDKYRLDHQLRPSEYDYFKIRLKNGQRLICSVRTTDVAHDSAIAIHSDERTVLKRADAYGVNISASCSWPVYNSPEKEKDLYIVIGCGQAVDVNIIYNITVEDNFDANTNTDAGSYYDNALLIKPGNYPNNWAPLSDNDMYSIRVKKAGEVFVHLVPDKTEGYFRITILNKDRETLASEWNKQPGSIVKASAINKGDTQKMYINIDRGGSGDSVGKYALKIEVK